MPWENTLEGCACARVFCSLVSFWFCTSWWNWCVSCAVSISWTNRVQSLGIFTCASLTGGLTFPTTPSRSRGLESVTVSWLYPRSKHNGLEGSPELELARVWANQWRTSEQEKRKHMAKIHVSTRVHSSRSSVHIGLATAEHASAARTTTSRPRSIFSRAWRT